MAAHVHPTARFRPRALVATVIAVVLLCVGSLASPASAYTTTENFVRKAYSDFLLRDPTTTELSNGVSYVGSNGRTAFLNQRFDTSEFANLWVIGVGLYYLGDVPSNASTLASSLTTSGDFVATEKSVIASSEYFTNAGGTNTGYVTAVYSNVLLRTPSSPDLAYWVNQLDTAAKTRTQVANYFIKSTEGSERRVDGPASQSVCSATTIDATQAIAAGTYCLVLDRLGDTSGVSYWTSQLAGSGQLPDVWASLGASTEYFNNAQI